VTRPPGESRDRFAPAFANVVGMKVPSRSNAPARTFPRVSYLVKELERALRARIDETLLSLELTAVQYTALSVLSLHEGMSSAQLARRSFVSPQAAHEMVGALERRGLIRRQVDAEGGRALAIFLTSRGERTLARCEDRVDALEASFLRGFSAREQAQFRAMLRTGRDAVRVQEAPVERATLKATRQARRAAREGR
jgi:DNA-binding MarR family transcriptional regulator